jgi:type I restriction enzyme R subunit
MALGLEKKLVEDYVIEKLKEIGWEYVEAERLNRLSYDEPLLIEDLKRKILEINKDTELTGEDLKKVINKLQGAYTDPNGHREILNYFKFGVPIKTEKEKIVKNIQLFDYKNLANNDFIFANQFEFAGRENIRLDIVLLVNGIPLVDIECKNPYTAKTDYYDAYRQIQRYAEEKAPELYKYIQIGIGYAEKVKYFPIVPWLDNVDQFVWKWEGFNDNDAIFVMLRPENLLDIIRNFLFIRKSGSEIKKVIARYMQFRATNKIYQRVIDNLTGKTEKNKGLIWHWQGSGKTLTMIFSAFKLYNEELLEKPTIFFIVDRIDLERQFNDELSFLDLGFNFEKVESINHLKEIIAHDEYRGKRGVFLTLIHKFNTEEEFILNELEDKGGINKRKNVICFLDEVHRSQYGLLALKMKKILKNGFFFGFTGTPIFYSERNTYREFGYIYDDEKEWYLDKYFIDEAERDGFVVPIVYERRREEVSLKDQDLEWYLEETVDIEDISDEVELSFVKNEIRRRINEITLFLENEKNIRIICQDIANHYKENFDGSFKGLIVAGSRLACVRFKKILDEYLPPEYSEVVMTFRPSDSKEPQEIEEYRKNLIARFNINDVKEITKKIIEKFKYEEYPKILIVTDMLITGFDEPKLGVLYLYKLLKNHKLLQTVARVNRPYIGKASGLIVDYVGIFKHLIKAYQRYTDESYETIRKAIIDKSNAFERLSELLNELKNIFGDLIGKFEREAFDKALELLKDSEIQTKFSELYNEARKWFEFLKGDERIIEYLTNYKWFSALYEYYKKIIRPDIDEEKLEKIFRKTISVIHDLIEVKPVLKIKKPTVIDINYIKTLKRSELTDQEKTIGILMALDHITRVYGERNPIYKSIANKVKELVQKWQEGDIDLGSLGIEVERIVEYISQKEEEKSKTKLNEIEFGVKLILENKFKDEEGKIIELAKNLYSQIKDSLYPYWFKNPAKVQEVKRITREFLIKLKAEYNLSYEEFDNLHKEIFDFIYSNASGV